MKRINIRLAAGIVAAGALVLAGTAAPRSSRTPFLRTGSYEEVACPATVVRNAQDTASCGYLTVPESRSEPSGRTIRLFVVRERPKGPLRTDPVLAIQELGSTRAWTDPDLLPSRVHREVITVDHRGLGRSEPSLACPEVESLAPSAMAAPINDSRTKARLLPAVQACHDRLTAAGVDLAAYNLRESAADAEDLRIALGIDRWNLRGLGTGARLVFEILRGYGDHVRAVWLDSPEIPQLDLLTTGILGTRHATRQLAAACHADRRCRTRFPQVERTLEGNLRAAERRPMTVHGRHDGSPIPIAVDGGTLLRVHREGLAWAPQIAPMGIAANSMRAPSMGYDWISDGPLFTLGYGVDPGREDVFAHGAWFSTICHDQLPFVTQASLNALTRSTPAYREAFAQSPLPDICGIWQVGAAATEIRSAVRSNVPVLIFVGRFDPYGSPPFARQAARTLPRSWIVEIPDEGYNGLADSYCALATRNAWIDRPTARPNTACVRRLPRISFQLG